VTRATPLLPRAGRPAHRSGISAHENPPTKRNRSHPVTHDHRALSLNALEDQNANVHDVGGQLSTRDRPGDDGGFSTVRTRSGTTDSPWRRWPTGPAQHRRNRSREGAAAPEALIRAGTWELWLAVTGDESRRETCAGCSRDPRAGARADPVPLRQRSRLTAARCHWGFDRPRVRHARTLRAAWFGAGSGCAPSVEQPAPHPVAVHAMRGRRRVAASSIPAS